MRADLPPPAPHPHRGPFPPDDPGPYRRLLLFAGARAGADPAHRALAAEVGLRVARAGVELVYGGGALGLMGVAARAAKEGGGRVIGVIPSFLVELEVAEDGLDERLVTSGLHERKAAMLARADAVLALPGGLGTLDELVELLSWRQLGLHRRPLWLLGGAFWRPFLDLLAHLEREGFAPPLAPRLLFGVDELEARLRGP